MDEWRERLSIREEKLTGYLLLKTHPFGGSKAVFFEIIGFFAVKPELFAAALMTHAQTSELTRVVEDKYGRSFVLEGTIENPRAREAVIRSVWLEREAGGPIDLITAYPLGRSR